MRAEQVERVENTFVLSVDGAFDVLPSHGTIQNGYLRGLVDLMRSRGCDPRQVLERNDIDSQTFEDPDQHTKCASAVSLLESCSGLSARSFVRGAARGIARSGCLRLRRDSRPRGADPAHRVAKLGRLRAGFRLARVRGRDGDGPGCRGTALADGHRTRRLRTGQLSGPLFVRKTLQMLAGPHFRPRYATLTFDIARPNLQSIQERLGCKVSGKRGGACDRVPRRDSGSADCDVQ